MNFKLPPLFSHATGLVLVVLASVGSTVHAQSNYTATGATSSWNSAGNWDNGIPGSGATATFNSASAPVSGSQTVYLDANQSVSGLIQTNDAGNLTISSDAGGSGGYALTLGTGGITSASSTALTINSNVVLNGNQTWTINNQGYNFNFNGALSGTGNLTVYEENQLALGFGNTQLGNVTGTATLTGNLLGQQMGTVSANFLNTFSGGVIVSGGAFYLNLSAGDFTVSKNLTLNDVYSGTLFLTLGGNVNFSGAVIGGAGGSGATIQQQFNAYNFTFSGTTDNTGLSFYANYAGTTTTLAKTSSASVHAIGGNLTMGDNTTVQLGGTGGDQIINSATVTLGSGTTFDLNGTSEAINILAQSSGTSVVTNTAASTTSTLTVGANNGSGTYSGVVQNGAGGTGVVALTKSGSGTLTLSGVNTYTGATTIAAGTLALDSTGSFANSAIVNLGTAGSQGTLDVTAKSSFAFGAGQTVAGYGTINIGAGKTVTINGNLAPGNSPGILTVTGNLALASGSTTTLELAGNGGVAGTDYDKVVVSGQITFGGTLNIVSYNAYNINQAATYQLFGFGSETGNFDSVSVASTALTNNGGVWSGNGSGFYYSFSQASGDLAVSAVPEPSFFAALTGGLALAGTWLVRRRKQTCVADAC